MLGAGPAGCAAALQLKSNGHDVAILNVGKTSGYQAVESIDAGIKDLLNKLNIDQSCFQKFHLPAYETISLWNGHVPIPKNAVFNANGHGWNLDKNIFNEQLQNACKNKGIPIVEVDKLNIEHEPMGGWSINCMIDSGSVFLSCVFLVDCTGRNRLLVKKLAIPVLKYDALIAINAIYHANTKEPPMASFIESAENGWWYSAALPQGKRVVSFFTNAKTAAFKNAIVYHNFSQNLLATKLLSAEINHYVPDGGTLHIRYANSEIATTLFGNDWICTGDAAATFDPLSSQGIGTALWAGISAASAVSNFIGSGKKTVLDQFAIDYHALFQKYLVQRSKYYQQINKWPKSNFWKENAKSSKFNIIKPVYNETKKAGSPIG